MKKFILFVEGVSGAFIILAAILTPFLTLWRKWGATADEVKRRLPGDEIVPQPKGGYTQAITIQAPQQQVWAWVAQTGQDRAGFYSYDFLENLAGCRIHTIDKIVPEFQHTAGSTGLKMHPAAPMILVYLLEPPGVLVFGGRMDPQTPVSWLFFIEKSGKDSSRLISRWLFSYKSGFGYRLGFGGFLQPIACVMQHKMLHGIKKRAERSNREKSRPSQGQRKT